MKLKHILLPMMACMALATSAQVDIQPAKAPEASRAEAEEMLFTYVPTDASVGTISTGSTTSFAYICLPAERTALYNGAKITKVRVVLGTFRSRPNFKINITKDCREDGYFEYQQDADVVSAEDSTTPVVYDIELDAPYTITGGEELYVGYQVATSSSSRPIVEGADTRLTITGTNDLYGYYSNNGAYIVNASGYANCIGLYIEGENLPANDIEILDGQLDNFGYPGADCALSAFIYNSGAQSLTAIDYEAVVSYGEAESQTLTGTFACDLGSCQTAELNMGLPVTADMAGDVDVVLTLTPSDSDDPTLSNNSWTGRFSVLAGTKQRTVLMEHFTTQACVNCPAADEVLEQVMEEVGDNVVWVSHHAGYETDFLTTQDDENYVWFYNGSTYAPAIMLDRTVLTSGSYTPVMFPSDAITVKSAINSALALPAIVELGAEASYDAASRTITFDITASPLATLSDREVRLNIYVMEDNIAGRQQSYDGTIDWTHNHVYRGNATGCWGTAIDLTKDYSGSFSYVIPDLTSGRYVYNKPEDMWACVFVSYFSTSNPAQCEVLNTQRVPLDLPAGIESVAVDQAFKAVGDCGAIRVTGAKAPVEVYGIDGSLRAKSMAESISVPSGVYIVRCGNQAQKVNVK
ncbi:MAG: Omp28-related outer membrane protein [Bacteroidales bacterium]|nr:Omp28-related outer membrane protein [Bacteroidales bacterium]